MRGRSYTPSPPRGYGRRGRSPPRGGRYSSRDAPTSLLVRNLRHDCRPEDLRRPFGQFGPVKDIYLPRDYYTGYPRGFGFVQYVDPADAAEAKYQMDGQILHGRELTVVFAEENRKKPTEMRARERGGRTGIVILYCTLYLPCVFCELLSSWEDSEILFYRNREVVLMIEDDPLHVILVLVLPVIPDPHLDMEGLILVAMITTLLLRENTQGQFPRVIEGTVERDQTRVLQCESNLHPMKAHVIAVEVQWGNVHHVVQEAAAKVLAGPDLQ
ncbi:hypothetical protein DH2020_000623 [Rehmannia glutinosa]|uniref:RRM domain-containing protein n=1 Tax=Rehmannia glutinosa TaxID=99300 RepID=A0ABR0XX45_REHGL